MLIGFFLHLKAARLPVSTREFLTLLEALEARVVSLSIDDFYYLARATLIKDEAQFDRYDLAFATYFKGVEAIFDIRAGIPEEWLRKEFERLLSDEDKARIEALGGWAKLMETLRERLSEQRSATRAATSGSAPAARAPSAPTATTPRESASGRRAAATAARSRSGTSAPSGTSTATSSSTRATSKVALRRLRRFAREGIPEELDMDGTIAGTARNAGYLDLHLVPERRNRVKVLLFLDVGGSMDPHVRVCEELFSATKTEFRHLEYFYFHNCVYDYVWRDNARRRNERVPTWDILHKYGADWKAIFVGDAAMSPYELVQAGGSVEYANDEPGVVWLKRIADHFRRVIWWNPEPPRAWEYTRSTQIVLQAVGPRMFPLTLDGIAQGIDALRH
jgi:uncharacterized protein with von Willebrand factor type A (vWA) domain